MTKWRVNAELLRRSQLVGFVLVFLVLAFLYYQSRSFDFGEHDQFIGALRQLKEEDAVLHRNILRARYAIDRTYDPLNASLSRLENTVTALRQSPIPERNRALATALKQFNDLHVRRKEILDRFKADNAVLRNSLYYLPISTARSQSLGGPVILLNSLLRDVLLYNLSGEEEYVPRIERRLLGLGSPVGHSESAVLVRHVRNILEKKKEVDHQIQEMDGLGSAKKNEELARAYEAWYINRLHLANIYRLLMFAVATGTLLYVLFVILKLFLARSYLAEANISLSQLNEAATRFVPHRFLKFLGRTNLRDVRLGDCRLNRMTVLFSDIRAFTTLSEAMTPEENFAFINSYLSTMGPIIRKHNGFIDKYIGDAIMALFDSEDDSSGAQSAVQSSIEMLRALEEYNARHRGGDDRGAVQIGIGLHVGQMMLGTIGEADRMEGTVISDAVNLASRIESLTKVYQTNLLISEELLAELGQPHSFSVRFIDEVVVKGKAKPIKVFEVFDADPDDLKSAKVQSAALMQIGFEHLRSENFGEAAKEFRKVLALLPGDPAARTHLERCWQVYTAPESPPNS